MPRVLSESAYNAFCRIALAMGTPERSKDILMALREAKIEKG